ncbi:MAG: hypothetical protein QOD33_1565, partial [Pyrinomonadaceae bacterium]|nr:hypothetical protein [Pyrinomonadaceae bacterium]
GPSLRVGLLIGEPSLTVGLLLGVKRISRPVAAL